MKKHIALVGALALSLSAPVVAFADASPQVIKPATGNNDGTTLTVSGGKTTGSGSIVVTGAETDLEDYGISLTSDDFAISFDIDYQGDVDASNVTLTFNVGARYAGARARVYYTDANGKTGYVDAKVAADGTVTVNLDSPVKVTVVVYGKTASGDNGGKVDDSNKSPQTGIDVVAVQTATGLALVAAAGCAVVARRRGSAE